MVARQERYRALSEVSGRLGSGNEGRALQSDPGPPPIRPPPRRFFLHRKSDRKMRAVNAGDRVVIARVGNVRRHATIIFKHVWLTWVSREQRLPKRRLQ